MNKKLIFYWYVPNEWNSIYDLHLKNIDFYTKQINFDEKLFCISYNKGDYTITPYIVKTIEKIREIVPDAKFIFYDNDPILRDGKFFYDIIATRLTEFNENDAVFFAHNKGKYSDYVSNFECNLWVDMMYYGNLYSTEKIDTFLNDDTKLCFITLCEDCEGWNHSFEFFKCQKYQWYNNGAFSWFKPHLLLKEMKEQNITLPPISRYFAEGFLGYVVPLYQNKMTVNFGIRKHNDDKNWIITYINSMPPEDRNTFLRIHSSFLNQNYF